jgi:hypothetical protein
MVSFFFLVWCVLNDIVMIAVISPFSGIGFCYAEIERKYILWLYL